MKKMFLLTLAITLLYNLFGAIPEWVNAERFGSTYVDLQTYYNDDSIICSTSDAQGNLYAVGSFKGQITLGTITIGTLSNVDRYFLAKFNTSGACLWASYFNSNAGGTNYNKVTDIAIDHLGNVFLTGTFNNILSVGSEGFYIGNQFDIFVCKFSSSGSWIWSKHAGSIDSGVHQEVGQGITVDNNGYIYLTGRYRGNASFGTITIPGDTSDEMFVSKMDNNGNWIWVTNTSGSGNCQGIQITTDLNGNCYVIGNAYTSNQIGEFTISSGSNNQFAFVVKVNSTGICQWGLNLSSSEQVFASDVITDLNNNVYFAIHYQNFITIESTTYGSDGAYNSLVGKLTPSGNTIWCRNIYGSLYNVVNSLLYFNNCVYLAGTFNANIHFGSIGLSVTSTGSQGFVSKMNSNGDWLWADNTEGVSDRLCGLISICPDFLGNVFVLGYFNGTTQLGQFTLNSDYYYKSDILIAKFLDQSFLSYTPQSVSFGNVDLTTSSIINVNLHSSGADSLRITDISLRSPSTVFQIPVFQLPIVISQGINIEIPVTFSPLSPITYCDTLIITNSSYNNPITEIIISGTGEYPDLSPPTNVTIINFDNDMHISWDPVSTTVLGDPISPDCYLVLYSEDEINYWLHGVTVNTNYIHYRIAEFRNNMFYQVIAYKDYGRGNLQRLFGLDRTKQKLTFEDLLLENRIE